MSWLLYSLAAMASLGVSMLAARQVSGLAPALSTLLDPKALPVILAYAGFSILGALFFLLALREPGAKTAVVAAIMALNIALVAVAAYVLFAETPSAFQVAGIALTIVSIILLSVGS
jgi:drug/metabolite transporter (DMT)-like permease